MKHRIRITESNIKNGIPQHCSRCPTALALRRQIPGVSWVVEEDYLDLDDEYPTPKSVRKFIEAFDHGKPVKPFSFTIEL